MKADAKTKAEVSAVMDQFLAAYQKRDIQALLGLLSQDDDVFLFGTGPDEKRYGKEQLKIQAERDWSQMDALNFKINILQVSSAGPAAWIAGDGVGKGSAGGQTFEFPMRFTAVLQQDGGKWHFAQLHMSLPASGEDEGDSVPV